MRNDTSNTDARPPFAYGWYSWDLGEYRPHPERYTTYSLFRYDELPPLPAPDATFAYFRAEDQPADRGQSSEASQQWEAEIRHKLDVLAGEAASLDMRLPEAFVSFMRSSELQGDFGVNSVTGWWLCLADHLVSCPGFAEGRLVGFQRDQQDCIVWCLCLLPGGDYRVLALGSDAVDTMASAQGDALLGQFDPTEDYDAWDANQRTDPRSRDRYTPEKVEEAIAGIVVCADTFEEFVYRFWLENDLYLKLRAEEINRYATRNLPGRYSQPMTEEERCYLDHYAHIYQQQRQPETSSG